MLGACARERVVMCMCSFVWSRVLTVEEGLGPLQQVPHAVATAKPHVGHDSRRPETSQATSERRENPPHLVF